MFNKQALHAKIIENGMTIGQLATDIGISYVTLHRKMTGESDFTRAEIHHIMLCLHLTDEDVNNIFFA